MDNNPAMELFGATGVNDFNKLDRYAIKILVVYRFTLLKREEYKND
jgi:hypothetical protein